MRRAAEAAPRRSPRRSRSAAWRAGDPVAVSTRAMLDLLDAVIAGRIEEATILLDVYGFTAADCTDLLALVDYELDRRRAFRAKRERAHRRAFALLRSFLS